MGEANVGIIYGNISYRFVVFIKIEGTKKSTLDDLVEQNLGNSLQGTYLLAVYILRFQSLHLPTLNVISSLHVI